MMTTYVDNGDMAPLILFYNGPASTGFNNVMANYYGTGYTPSFFCDGVWENIGWNQGSSQGAIDSRLNDPAYLTIDISVGGDDNEGVVFYNITAEQDLESVGLIRLMSAMVESDISCNATWGVYNGQIVDWIPRVAPLGNAGVTLDFTGPYPQTISVQGEYDIASSWEFDNMGIVAFVMDYDDKSVFNAYYSDDLNSIMGVEGESEYLNLSVGPNPSAGTFAINAVVPEGGNGTVQVFDLSGRTVAGGSVQEMQNVTVNEAGIYLVRLTTENGVSVTESVAVVR